MALPLLYEIANSIVFHQGVETEMEMKELEEAGCDRLQGFLFSKPIPFEEVGPFIQKYYKTRF